MPSRSSPNSASSSFGATYRDKNGDEAQLIGDSPSTLRWVDSVTFGDNVKGWRDNLRAGLSATTSMSGSRSSVRITNGHIKLTVEPAWVNALNKQSIEMTGTLGITPGLPAGDPSAIDETKADSQALGKFAQRIFDVNHEFQGGAFVGELLQTIRMIKNPAQGLRKLVDDWGFTARRIRGSKVVPLAYRTKSVAANLADAYLEAVFGWQPFLHDVRDATKALDRYHTGQALGVRRITAHAEVGGSPSVTSVKSSSSLLVWQGDERTVSSTNVIYRGGMRVAARDPKKMDVALFGFDPASWLPTAWEIMPYSFLIDYFTNISEIITGWSTLFTELAWCNRTTRNSWESTTTSFSDLPMVKAEWPLFVKGVTCTPAIVVATKRSVSRAKFNGITVPGLTFEIPGLGSKKWLNIAALIASRDSDRKWFFGD